MYNGVSYDGLTIINELKDLEQRAYKTSIKIQSQIKNNILDARASTFIFLAVAIRSFKMYLILKKEYLDDRQWYIDVYLKKYRQQWPISGGKIGTIINDHNVLTNDFNMVMLIGYTQILYSILESKFRLYLTAIDPNAQQGGKFFIVHDNLLRKIRKKTRYKKLIEFFSLVRNTIHNNGKYVNNRRKYVSKNYRGAKYEFRYNQVVNYRGGAPKLLFLQITPDVMDMMEDIILNSKKLKQINSIPEPVL